MDQFVQFFRQVKESLPCWQFCCPPGLGVVNIDRDGGVSSSPLAIDGVPTELLSTWL